MIAVIGMSVLVILAIIGNLIMRNLAYFLYTCFICGIVYYTFFAYKIFGHSFIN